MKAASSPSLSLSFHDATVSDVPAVVDLVESAYRGDRGKQGWTTETDLLDGQRTDRDEVHGLVTRAGSRVRLAYEGDTLVGSAHLERHAGSCHFGMFAVDPYRQRGGIGKALLAEAERVAREEWGCREMTMTVIDVRPELLAFYARRGYARTGEIKPFPYGDPRFGVPKRDDLRFEVLRKPLA